MSKPSPAPFCFSFQPLASIPFSLQEFLRVPSSHQGCFCVPKEKEKRVGVSHLTDWES